MRGALVLVLAGVLSACSDSSVEASGCSGNDDCRAGTVCVNGECRELCFQDSDCAAGEICPADGLCVAGERTDTPTILTIDSNGSEDPDPDYGGHRIGDALTILGEHLEGSSVALVGSSEALLQVTSTSDSQLVALLPTDIQAGTYTVRVFNQVGEDQGGVTLLRGEAGPQGVQGEQGPEGPAGPLNMFTTDTTISVPGDHATIHEALDFLDDWVIASNAIVTIEVTAGATYDSPINIEHPNGDRLRIIGDTDSPITLLFTGCHGLLVQRGATLREMDGFQLMGNLAADTHGVIVSDAAVLFLGTSMEIQSFGAYGLWVVRTATVYAPELSVRNNSAIGVVVQQNSYVNINDATIENNGSHGIFANESSVINAARTTVQSNDLHGVVAYQGSSISLIDATVQNNGRIGVYAWLASNIRADRVQSLNNGTDTSTTTSSGIQADSNSAIYAPQGRSNGNSGTGVYAVRGAIIEFRGTGTPTVNAVSNNNGAWGIYAGHGAYISAQNTTVSGNGNTSDGGLSPAAGTVGNANAYIYRP